MIKLNAKQLRTSEPDPNAAVLIPKHPIYIILDNVLDTYNIGSIFRLADAVAAQKVFLCGSMETPPNTRIKKASVNTWMWVEWEYSPSALTALENLKSQISNLKIVAVEQDKRSRPFYEVHYDFPLAIVVGNESFGVSKEVLDVADTIVELPMWGINTSLNVMVSCGIILYEVMKQQKEHT